MNFFCSQPRTAKNYRRHILDIARIKVSSLRASFFSIADTLARHIFFRKLQKLPAYCSIREWPR